MRTEQLKKYKELLHRYQTLLCEYEILLESFEEGESPEEIFPLHTMRPLIVERRCSLLEREPSLIEMLVAPGNRELGLKEIRDFTKDTEKLIVIDPYIFSGSKEAASQIAQEFARAARISGRQLRDVHIVYDLSHSTNAVKKAVENVAKTHVRLTMSTSEDMHDRVWIADRNRALAVGTSLNGIGKRAAFLLPLPKSDLDALLEFMDENSLSRVRKEIVSN